MSKNAILKTISLKQIGRKKFYRTAINLLLMYPFCRMKPKSFLRRSSLCKYLGRLLSLSFCSGGAGLFIPPGI